MNAKIAFLLLCFLYSMGGPASAKEEAKNPLFEKCSKNNVEKLWAQQQIDADLMLEYIQKKGLRAAGVKSPVIVLDTGFDQKQIAHMVKAKELQVLPGVYDEQGKSKVGEPTKDVIGHGTMVGSVIGAEGGIGVAPNSRLTVYRITAGDDGTTSDAYIEAAIRLACKNALAKDPRATPIINESWGSREDEMGKKRDEENGQLMQFLKDNGCLVVKAAGNSNFIRNDAAIVDADLSDPILRVGATAPQGGRTDFSSNGVVNAPGQRVYTRVSSVMKDKPSDNKICGTDADGSEEAFVDGTSFASPLTAGIAAELVGVLRSRPKFDQLSAWHRLTLVSRILKASMLGGTINGLRAVKIAELWNAAPDTKNLALSAELAAAFTQHPDAICAPAAEPDSTIKNLRARASLCPASETDFKTLIAIAESQTAMETGAKYIRLLSDLGTAPDFVNAASMRLVEQKLQDSNGQGLDNNTMRELFPHYLDNLVAHPEKKQVAEQAMKNYLESPVFHGAVDAGPGRGSEEIIEATLVNLQKLESLYGKDELVPFLSEYFDDALKNGGDGFFPTSESYMDIAEIRLLNAIGTESRFQEIAPELSVYDRKFFAEMDQYRGAPPPKKDQDCAWITCYFGEAPATYRYYEEFLQRNPGLLQEQVDAANDSLRMNSIKSMYIRERLQTLLTQEQREKFVFQGMSYAERQKDRVGAIKELIEDNTSTPDQIKNAYLAYLEKSSNPVTLTSAADFFSESYNETVNEGISNPETWISNQYKTILRKELLPGGKANIYTIWNEDIPPFGFSADAESHLSRRAFLAAIAALRAKPDNMDIQALANAATVADQDPISDKADGRALIHQALQDIAQDCFDSSRHRSGIAAMNKFLIAMASWQLSERVCADPENRKLLQVLYNSFRVSTLFSPGINLNICP